MAKIEEEAGTKVTLALTPGLSQKEAEEIWRRRERLGAGAREPKKEPLHGVSPRRYEAMFFPLPRLGSLRVRGSPLLDLPSFLLVLRLLLPADPLLLLDLLIIAGFLWAHRPSLIRTPLFDISLIVVPRVIGVSRLS